VSLTILEMHLIVELSCPYDLAVLEEGIVLKKIGHKFMNHHLCFKDGYIIVDMKIQICEKFCLA
jgi:hypothetical protein